MERALPFATSLPPERSIILNCIYITPRLALLAHNSRHHPSKIMGNSPSNTRKNSISSPRRLPHERSTRYRSNDLLDASQSSNFGHRRSRSANAAVPRRYLDSDVVPNPPPPYSRTPPAYLEDLKYSSKPLKGSRSSVSLSPSSSSAESTKKSKHFGPIGDIHPFLTYLKM